MIILFHIKESIDQQLVLDVIQFDSVKACYKFHHLTIIIIRESQINCLGFHQLQLYFPKLDH